MSAWDLLSAELDAWQADGRVATFWWRDDDAAALVPNLDRLIALAGERDIPLSLACIPRTSESSMLAVCSSFPHVYLLQHGFAHVNHEEGVGKKSEYGPSRPIEDVVLELGEGWNEIRHFPNALPVLVPPWNRITDDIIEVLPHTGFRGLSTYKPRTRPALDKLTFVNTHVDIIDWKGERGFLGEDATLALCITHLKARRTGEADADEPTGLLTHHLDHDEACWTFLETFTKYITNHSATRWVSPGEAFKL